MVASVRFPNNSTKCCSYDNTHSAAIRLTEQNSNTPANITAHFCPEFVAYRCSAVAPNMFETLLNSEIFVCFVVATPLIASVRMVGCW